MADLATAKSLRDKELTPLVGEIYRLRDVIANEKRDFTAEEQEKWDKVNKEYDTLKAKIDILERSERVEKEMGSATVTNPPGREDYTPNSKKDKNKEREGRDQPSDEDRALAIQAWLRRGVGRPLDKRQAKACQRVGIDPKSKFYGARFVTKYREWRASWRRGESRALSVTQVTSGGATIPEGFVQNLEEALLQFGGIRMVADVIRTASGNDLPWPTLNDTTNKGAILSENTTVTNQDVPFGQVVFHAYKYTSKEVLVPVELIEDSAFDLAEELGRLLGIRIGRITADHFTTGSGASQPTGIITAATSGYTGGSTTAILGDDIYELKHSVDPAYRTGPGVGFMMHDTIFKTVKKIKDGTGRYLWQASLAGRQPDTLDGDPVYLNQSMDNSVASGKKTIAYGDLSKYKIRDVSEFRLRRLVERYADADQVGFIAFSRHDGDLLDAGTHPVKYLTH